MRRLPVLLFVLAFTSSAFAATTLSQLVAQYGDLKAGATHSAADLNVTVGHMTFTGGNTATVLHAGGQPVGLFVTGGTFSYELANADELAAVRYNAKHGDIALTTSGDKTLVTEKFKTALIVGNGLPQLTGTATTGNESIWSEHKQLFDRNSFVAPPAHLFAYAALDAPTARVVRAEINASKPYVYTYDGALLQDETLEYLRYSQYRATKLGDVLWPRPLSKQAIGRGNRVAPAPRIRLTDVDVNLVGKMNEEATLTVVETLVPQKRAASAIHFDLNKYLYFDPQREPRRYNLRKVVDEQGTELGFSHENGDLVVALAKPAAPNQPLKLRFEIDGDFLYRHEKTNFWELGIDPWFPWVQMHEQRYTFHSLIKVEKPFVVFASGKTLKRADEGDYHVIETKLDQPVRWVSVLAGKYQFDEETKNGVTVRIASFIAKNKEAYKTLRNIAFAAIDYYPTFLGPFPYEEITVIEKTDGWAYGQAPAGIVFITSEAFTPKLGEANTFVQGVNHRFAHEIAHAYWGGAVSMPTVEDQWIDEAFAEYSAALFMKAAKKGEYDKRFIEWKDSAKRFNENATVATANRLHHPGDPVGTQMARQALLYFKGAYLLAALHSELGDQTFLTFLKSYQKSLRYKDTSTKDVIDLLQFLTKKDYAPWFETNFYSNGFPEFAKPK